MRKFLFCFFILGIGMVAIAQSQDEKSLPNPVPIIKGDYGDHIKIQPRSIVAVPLTCVYKAGQVELCFLEDLGEAEVFVTSLTTGEQWSTIGDTAAGVLTVAASEEAGEYVVQIYADGDAWYGCYTIE